MPPLADRAARTYLFATSDHALAHVASIVIPTHENDGVDPLVYRLSVWWPSSDALRIAQAFESCVGNAVAPDVDEATLTIELESVLKAWKANV